MIELSARPDMRAHLGTPFVLELTSAGIAAAILEHADTDELLEFTNRCSAFFELVKGRAPSRDDTAHMIDERPNTVPRECKLLIGLRRNQKLLGVLDLLHGYPDSNTWFLGLLVLDPNVRREGIGSTVYAAIRRWATGYGARRIQLIVQEQNPSAFAFWRAMGFSESEKVIQQLVTGSNQVSLMSDDFK